MVSYCEPRAGEDQTINPYIRLRSERNELQRKAGRSHSAENTREQVGLRSKKNTIGKIEDQAGFGPALL